MALISPGGRGRVRPPMTPAEFARRRLEALRAAGYLVGPIESDDMAKMWRDVSGALMPQLMGEAAAAGFANPMDYIRARGRAGGNPRVNRRGPFESRLGF